MEDENARLLPKYHMKSERKAFIRNRQKSLIIQLYLRMLLTFLGSCICTTLLACLKMTIGASIPLYVIFLPLFIGHVIAIGIYIYLSQTLYSFCRVPVPPSAKRKPFRTSFVIEEDMIPIVHRFLTVGSWLMLGTVLLVCAELLVYFKLAGSGLSALAASTPVLLGATVYFLQGIMCKGQNWIATLGWLLLLVGVVLLDEKLDGHLGGTISSAAVLAPLFALLALLIFTFARLLTFHAIGTIYLTSVQFWATYGYLTGSVMLLVATVTLASCSDDFACGTNQSLTIWASVLAAELCFVISVYRVTRQQVQLSLARSPAEGTPLPLARSASGAGWEVDRSRGHFGVVFVGSVRYDAARGAAELRGPAFRALWFLCCGGRDFGMDQSGRGSSRRSGGGARVGGGAYDSDDEEGGGREMMAAGERRGSGGGWFQQEEEF